MIQRPIQNVLTEALIIGLMNAGLFYIIKMIQPSGGVIPTLIICGALIHIIFEYTGGNEWWCRKTYKDLKRV